MTTLRSENREIAADESHSHGRSGMFELYEHQPRRPVLRNVVGSVPRIGVASLFVIVGSTKFDGDPNGEWYRVFELIGIGQWFRYATVGIQVAGGLLMLFRRSLAAGAGILGCTMIGAALVDVFVLGSPLVLVPLVLLFLIAIIWVTSE
jgi:putative oxidoreductase